MLFKVSNKFYPGIPASSTTKTGHHDIAEILLKVALKKKHQSLKQSIVGSIKTDRHDIPAILVKVALNTIKQTKTVYMFNLL
jgi:hypothetical protein